MGTSHETDTSPPTSDGDTVLNSETRCVQDLSENSFSCNLTEYGSRTLGLSQGDVVTVTTYPDRIVIKPATLDTTGGGDR